MDKMIFTILSFLAFGLVTLFVLAGRNDNFDKLSPKEMYEKIIMQRDYAIAKAVEAGDYRCCINPACTMCYMEANKWNNQTPGTCACDDLIARGEEPCPQCLAGSCDGKSGSCEIGAN